MISQGLWPGIAFGVGALALCGFVAAEPSRHCPIPTDWLRGQAEYGLSAASIVELSAARTIKWNGKEISWSQLADQLRKMRELPFGVIVIFRPDRDAPCDDKTRVRAMMRRWNDCQSGLCGEGPKWDDFKGPSAPNI